MRLCHLLAALLPALALSSQLPFEIQSATLVDLLADDADFTQLIKLLQRTRLIPLLNVSGNYTLLAPTNKAIQDWQHNNPPEQDNRQLETRQAILYHLVNYTLPEKPTLEETLSLPNASIETLGGHGQMLRFATADNGNLRAGVDSKGNGGIELISKPRQARNGIFYAVDKVLELPKSTAEVIQTHPSLTKLKSILPAELLANLSSLPHLTLFAPSDESWDDLDPLEWQFLNSGYAQSDLLDILEMHSTQQIDSSEPVGYSPNLLKHTNVTTRSGDQLIISQSGDAKFAVNDSTIIESDILTSNGVIHISKKLLLPSGSLELNVEKLLLALNATRFVDLLRSNNLSEYIEQPASSGPAYTILAPRDDLIAGWDGGWTSLPPEGSQELKDTLLYHIVEGALEPENLVDGALIATQLRTDGLKQHKQRLMVTATKNKKDTYDYGFGDANVVSDRIKAGNSNIYLLSQVLTPPANPVQTALTDLRLSTFVASLYAAQIDQETIQAAGTTFLAPVNDAFSKLGLAISYLLLPASIEALQKTLKYHIVDEIVYHDSLPVRSGAKRFNTLAGDDIYINRRTNLTKVHGPTLRGDYVNGDRSAALLVGVDALTSTGVLHVTNQVELPPSVQISVGDLVKGAKAATMADLIRLANMTWIMDGQPAPTDFLLRIAKNKKQKKEETGPHNSYILLCPSDRAFTRINISYYISNSLALRQLVELHIIPSQAPTTDTAGKPLALVDDAVYSTLHSKSRGGSSAYGDLAFTNVGKDDWVVGIKGASGTGASGDWARITNFGKSTPIFNDDETVRYGGVLQLDQVLIPFEPSWWTRNGWVVAVILLCVAGTSCIGLLTWKLWMRKKQADYESIQDNEED